MTQERSAEEVFGAEVRRARELRGWTQEHLRTYLRDASGIELSSTAMARLEQGKRPIRLNEVSALAQILDIDLRRYGERPTRVTEIQYRTAKRRLEDLGIDESTARYRLQLAESDRATAAQELKEIAVTRERLLLWIKQYEQGNKTQRRSANG